MTGVDGSDGDGIEVAWMDANGNEHRVHPRTVERALDLLDDADGVIGIMGLSRRRHIVLHVDGHAVGVQRDLGAFTCTCRDAVRGGVTGGPLCEHSVVAALLMGRYAPVDGPLRDRYEEMLGRLLARRRELLAAVRSMAQVTEGMTCESPQEAHENIDALVSLIRDQERRCPDDVEAMRGRYWNLTRLGWSLMQSDDPVVEAMRILRETQKEIEQMERVDEPSPMARSRARAIRLFLQERVNEQRELAQRLGIGGAETVDVANLRRATLLEMRGRRERVSVRIDSAGQRLESLLAERRESGTGGRAATVDARILVCDEEMNELLYEFLCVQDELERARLPSGFSPRLVLDYLSDWGMSRTEERSAGGSWECAPPEEGI